MFKYKVKENRELIEYLNACNIETNCNSYRYTILAPTILPKGFVDAKIATEKLIKEINLDENEFRFGNTKVTIFNNVYFISALN
jgi:hypothetical protein